MSQAIRWCGTLNNYTDLDEVILKNFFKDSCHFGICGKEVGANNTPHLQFYFRLKSKTRLSTLKNKFFYGAHYEVARGDEESNIKYCSKQEVFFQYGIPKTRSQSVPSSGADMAEAMAQGACPLDLTEQNDAAKQAYVMYKANIDSIAKDYKARNVREELLKGYETVTWKPFQKMVLDMCESKPHDRQIAWYWEMDGGVGKTYLSKYMVLKYGAVRFENNKSADIKYAWNGEEIVIFDYSRSQEDHINYEILECIKNGICFSSKYESRMKVFPIPHVIVFANFHPDMNKLSLDRWNVLRIDSSLLIDTFVTGEMLEGWE